MLPEDALLEIFDFYRLDAIESSEGRPWKWHRLAHVCRRWRHVISISPCRLDLRILCEYGTPFGGILQSWPTLPLFVRFDARRHLKHMPGNIVVALRHPDRLCEIDLGVTSSMTGPIVDMIQKRCQALEGIRIKVEELEDATNPSILIQNAFLGGSAPHLRKIELDGIAFPFPEIQRVLLSTNNLVELHLSRIPHAAYFSPSDLITALSTLVQLKSLTIGFHFPASYPPPSMMRPPSQRITLPFLTSLNFHGASEYLEEFAARIDSPALIKITIWLFINNQIFFDIPQFRQFISHLDARGFPTEVSVEHSAESVSVSLIRGGGNTPNTICVLGTSCRRLDWQLSFVTQILTQLSPFLSSVHLLENLTPSESSFPTGEEDVDSAQLQEFFQPFTHVKAVYVWRTKLVPGIVQALVTDSEDMVAGVLPELASLHLTGYRKSSAVAKAAKQFAAMRSLSGHPVSLSGW